jgi:predicted nucleic acid-binding protein
LLDDGLGRRAAELLGIPLTGTLGVLISSRKKGLRAGKKGMKLEPKSAVADEIGRLGDQT